MISSWTNFQSPPQIINTLSITNPQAAAKFNITGLLYFIRNSVNYLIQTFSCSVSLDPLSYTSLTFSTLSYGYLSSLQVNSSCPFK